MNLSRLALCLALASSTAGAASFAVKPGASVASRSTAFPFRSFQ